MDTDRQRQGGAGKHAWRGPQDRVQAPSRGQKKKHREHGQAIRKTSVGSHLCVGSSGIPPVKAGDPLEKEMATHSSIPVWEIPWTEEPGGLQSMGSQKSQDSLSD